MNKAWFLDRDGTIIEDKHYLSDPKNIAILPEAAEAMKAAQDDGFLLIVITNQSGIARGYFDMAEADAVDGRLREMLAEKGVNMTAIYRCPHLPNGIPPYNIQCNCRKPETGMFSAAIADFDLNPTECIACGDKFRDVMRLPEIGIPEKNTGVIDAEHYNNLMDFYTAVKAQAEKGK